MHIFQYDLVSSTMDKALVLSKNIDDDDFCVLAQEQQSGKGTQGRIWHSPKGNFYATYAFKKNKYQVTEIGQLALISGISCAEILRHHNVDICLKWSNDLMLDDKKTGGILSIIQDDYIMIGVGLNFISSNHNQAILPSFFPATFIDDYICLLDLAQEIGNQLKHNLNLYNQQGFSDFQQSWQQYSAFHNRVITLQLPDKTLKIGIDNGIDSHGRLIIQTQSGIECFYSARIIKVERGEYVL